MGLNVLLKQQFCYSFMEIINKRLPYSDPGSIDFTALVQMC